MAETRTTKKRHVTSQETILDVANQIIEKYHPEKIVLFGSYAQGIPKPDSDVDLLIVMPLEKKPIRQAIEILQNIDYHFSLDLIVRSPGELKRRIELGDSFLRDAVERGVVLYESTS